MNPKRIKNVWRVLLILISVTALVTLYQKIQDSHGDNVQRSIVIEHKQQQGSSTIETERVSYFKLTGGNGYGRANERLLWHFRNVCYSSSKKALIYYQDPSELIPPPIMFNNGTRVNFGSIPYSSYQTNLHRLDTQIEKSHVPQDAYYVKEDVAVWSIPLFGHNYGHYFVDGVFPIFHALRQLDLGSVSDAHVIWPGSNAKSFVGKWGVAPGILASDPHNNYHHLSDRELTCFKNFVIGVNSFQFSRHENPHFPDPGWASSYRDFRNLVREKVAGLQPTDNASKQAILVAKKEGKRGILNHDDLVAHLRYIFPSVLVRETTFDMSPHEQLKLLSETSVFVSPAGGISMISMFSADFTVGVFPDFWNWAAKESVGMEQHFYQLLPWFTNFQYPVTPDEIYIPSQAQSKSKEKLYRDFGEINVDLKRMSKLVYSALYRVKQMRGNAFDFDVTRFVESL